MTVIARPTSRALGLYKENAADPIEVRIKTFSTLVKKMAYHLVTRLPASVDVGDLIQAGLIGLMEAARNFDTSMDVQFETYASQRIRGAMLDELRNADWLPRQLRRSMRQIENAIAKLEHQLGRAALENEIAQSLNISLTDYQSTLADCRGHQLIYYDNQDNEEEGSHFLDSFANNMENLPLKALSDNNFRKALVKSIEGLPEREKLVMALYYEQELNLKEIGAVLHISESRVCQLHSQAVARLRVALREWIAESVN